MINKMVPLEILELILDNFDNIEDVSAFANALGKNVTRDMVIRWLDKNVYKDDNYSDNIYQKTVDGYKKFYGKHPHPQHASKKIDIENRESFDTSIFKRWELPERLAFFLVTPTSSNPYYGYSCKNVKDMFDMLEIYESYNIGMWKVNREIVTCNKKRKEENNKLKQEIIKLRKENGRLKHAIQSDT